MLVLHEYNETNFTGGGLGALADAWETVITEAVNGEKTLEFNYPKNGMNARKLKPNRIVVCGGEAFRIMSADITADGQSIVRIAAKALFWADCAKIHIQHVPNHMGEKPDVILSDVFKNTPFNYGTVPEGIDAVLFDDEFKIDFWECDKVTPIEVMNAVIEAAGCGEICAKNFDVALVMRRGKDSGAAASIDKNADKITVTKDISELVTRLYPYGANDLHIASQNNGKQYIDSSEGIAAYGVREGFLDFSDYTDAAMLKERAEWEFSADNENRIDRPKITVSAEAFNLFKGGGTVVNLGDTVTVKTADGVHRLRVKEYTYYPYEPQRDRVTLGEPERNLFFYLVEFKKNGYYTNKNTNTSGALKTTTLAGTVNTTQNILQSENDRLTLNGDLLTIKDTNRERIRIGNSGNEFAFTIYNANGDETVYMNEDGDAVFSGSIDTSKDVNVGEVLRLNIIDMDNNGGLIFADGSDIAAQVFVRDGTAAVTGNTDKTMYIQAGNVYVIGKMIAPMLYHGIGTDEKYATIAEVKELLEGYQPKA